MLTQKLMGISSAQASVPPCRSSAANMTGYGNTPCPIGSFQI